MKKLYEDLKNGWKAIKIIYKFLFKFYYKKS